MLTVSSGVSSAENIRVALGQAKLYLRQTKQCLSLRSDDLQVSPLYGDTVYTYLPSERAWDADRLATCLYALRGVYSSRLITQISGRNTCSCSMCWYRNNDKKPVGNGRCFAPEWRCLAMYSALCKLWKRCLTGNSTGPFDQLHIRCESSERIRSTASWSEPTFWTCTCLKFSSCYVD